MLHKWISAAIICGLISLTTALPAMGTSHSISSSPSIEIHPENNSKAQQNVGFTFHNDPGLDPADITWITFDRNLSPDVSQCDFLLVWDDPILYDQVDYVAFYYYDHSTGILEFIDIVYSPPYQVVVDICELGVGWHQFFAHAFDSADKLISSERILLYRIAAVFIPLLLNSK